MLENKLTLYVIGAFLMLGLLAWFAFQEYSTESRVCLEKGGKLVYENETKTLYCELPKPVRTKSWWEW